MENELAHDKWFVIIKHCSHMKGTKESLCFFLIARDCYITMGYCIGYSRKACKHMGEAIYLCIIYVTFSYKYFDVWSLIIKQ